MTFEEHYDAIEEMINSSEDATDVSMIHEALEGLVIAAAKRWTELENNG